MASQEANAIIGGGMTEHSAMSVWESEVVARPVETSCNGLDYLKGQRLVLRPPLTGDAESVYAYASDPVVTRFLAWPRHTSPAASERFIGIAKEKWRAGRELVWLIEDENGVVGSIGAGISRVNAGIGYVLARSSWGQGYASEALQLVSEALHRLSPVQSMWALCAIENTASARVLKKGGFHAERTLRRYLVAPNLQGRPLDVVVYSRRLSPTHRRRTLPHVRRE